MLYARTVPGDAGRAFNELYTPRAATGAKLHANTHHQPLSPVPTPLSPDDTPQNPRPPLSIPQHPPSPQHPPPPPSTPPAPPGPARRLIAGPATPILQPVGIDQDTNRATTKRRDARAGVASADAIQEASSALKQGLGVVLATPMGYVLLTPSSPSPNNAPASPAAPVHGMGDEHVCVLIADAGMISERSGNLGIRTIRTATRLARKLPAGSAILRLEGDPAGVVLGDQTGSSIASKSSTAVGLIPLTDKRDDPANDADEALDLARGLGVEVGLVLDSGATPTRRGATVVGIGADGTARVIREGVVEERYVRKQMTRTILFVCTGNTCRSPMAEAIARHILQESGEQETTRVVSAGVATGGGSPMTREARDALGQLGVPAGEHASRALTRDLLAGADEVYAMTRAHLDSIASFDASATDKSALLDPDGRDIEDPIGLDANAYLATARAIESLIRRRLAGPTSGDEGQDR